MVADQCTSETDNELADLNTKIAQMEVQRDKEAELFFNEVLSEEMIFRRSNTLVEGKEQFLKGLQREYPFKELACEDFKIYQVDGVQSRALVTLVVVGTPKNEEGEVKRRFRNIRLFSKADDSVRKVVAADSICIGVNTTCSKDKDDDDDKDEDTDEPTQR